MNLTSCEKCGVVIDKDKLVFPEDLYKDKDEGYVIDLTKAVWNGDDYVAFAPCPICGSEILK